MTLRSNGPDFSRIPSLLFLFIRKRIPGKFLLRNNKSRHHFLVFDPGKCFLKKFCQNERCEMKTNTRPSGVAMCPNGQGTSRDSKRVSHNDTWDIKIHSTHILFVLIEYHCIQGSTWPGLVSRLRGYTNITF